MNGAVVIGIMITGTMRAEVIVARHRHELSEGGGGIRRYVTAGNSGVVTDFPLHEQSRED